jgi:hypothetical protein
VLNWCFVLSRGIVLAPDLVPGEVRDLRDLTVFADAVDSATAHSYTVGAQTEVGVLIFTVAATLYRCSTHYP